MNVHIEWSRPIQLRDARRENMIYSIDLSKITLGAGVYVFGRRWGSQFEALYVGKAGNLRSRVKGHFNNLRLMQHLSNAKTGKRILLVGRLVTRQGQQPSKCLSLAERALIRYFLSEGHDLVNKQGTRLRRHEIESSGRHPKRFFPNVMHVERARGE
ncbi:MAG: hypothetical protein JW809_09655 [Pirellulales bacterium]|nr:hypothetical protein [Pirellulales bacterium]